MKKIIICLTVLISTSNIYSQLWLPSGNDIYNANTGDVLIGDPSSTTPSKLRAASDIYWNGNQSLLSIDHSGSIELGSSLLSGTTPYIDFHYGTHSPGDNYNARIINTADNKLVFKMYNSGSPLSSMTILNDKVGIGTENPLAGLHLKGNSATRLQLENSDASSNSNKINFKDALGENYLEVKGGSSGYFSFKTDANGDASAQMVILNNGSVGIGTESPSSTYKLSVNGKIRAKELKVQTDWSDFVFNNDYKLKSLEEVESYIKENKHLPDIPTEQEVKDNGVELGEMTSKLLQKVEELTLHAIELQKEITNLRKELEELKGRQEKR